MGRECKSCIYFDPEASGSFGKCLRYPPQIVAHPEVPGIIEGDTIISVFPDVKYSEWCGEYIKDD
jgi:hypothetical protein